MVALDNRRLVNVKRFLRHHLVPYAVDMIIISSITALTLVADSHVFDLDISKHDLICIDATIAERNLVFMQVLTCA